MESDTKNNLGRPRTVAGIMTRIFQEQTITENGLRGAMNVYYAMHFLHECYGRPDRGSFFVSECGKIRRQGIAEQIGRMMKEELITVEQARDLAEEAVKDYNSGKSVKEIAGHLYALRQILR